MPVGPVVPPGICHPDPSSVIPTEAKRAEGSACPASRCLDKLDMTGCRPA